MAKTSVTKTQTDPRERVTENGLTVLEPFMGGYAAKSCARKIHNDLTLPESAKTALPDAVVRRMSDGVEFEARVKTLLRNRLLATGDWHVVELDDAAASGTNPADLFDAAVFIADVALDENGERTVAGKARKEADTLFAMECGATLIWNGRFPGELVSFRNGEPDLLVRHGSQRKPNGKWAYLPVDVKHHKELSGKKATEHRVSDLDMPLLDSAYIEEAPGKGQRNDGMQLAHYYRILEVLGHHDEGRAVWGGIIGKSLRVFWRNLAEETERHAALGTCSVLAINDRDYAERRKVATRALEINQDPSLPALAIAENKTECKECEWRDVCRTELIAQSHITLVPGITPPRAERHYEAGVTSYVQLANLDYATAVAVEELGPELLSLIESAKTFPNATWDLPDLVGNKAATRLAEFGLTTPRDFVDLDELTASYATGGVAHDLTGSIDASRAKLLRQAFRRRGVESVTVPRAKREVHFDLENDGDQIMYLMGMRVDFDSTFEDGVWHRSSEFTPHVCWDNDEDAERKVLASFWASVQEQLAEAVKEGLTIRFYHFAHHERWMLRKIAARHAGKPGVPTVEELEEWLSGVVDADGRYVPGELANDDTPENERLVVDMYKILSKELVLPTEAYGLKHQAVHAGFSWSDEDPGGANSIAWYEVAVSDPDPAVRAEYQKRTVEYNADDVAAQAHLLDSLQRAGEPDRLGSRLPEISILDLMFARRSRLAA